MIFSDILTRFSAVTASVYNLACRRSWKRFSLADLFWVGAGNLRIVPNTSSDLMRPFGPIVSYIALMGMRRVALLSRDI